MTPEEIEKEVQARVEFKLSELLTGVKNRVAFKYKQAFDMTQKSQHAWQAFEELEGMLRKEIEMATPYDNMDKRRKWQAKQIAVDEIMSAIKDHIHPHRGNIVNSIVASIEKAQNY